jgi:hypothetical protein
MIFKGESNGTPTVCFRLVVQEIFDRDILAVLKDFSVFAMTILYLALINSI